MIVMCGFLSSQNQTNGITSRKTLSASGDWKLKDKWHGQKKIDNDGPEGLYYQSGHVKTDKLFPQIRKGVIFYKKDGTVEYGNWIQRKFYGEPAHEKIVHVKSVGEVLDVSS